MQEIRNLAYFTVVVFLTVSIAVLLALWFIEKQKFFIAIFNRKPKEATKAPDLEDSEEVRMAMAQQEAWTRMNNPWI